MAYALADLEITKPLPTLTLSRQESGVAVLLRRAGRPVGFWMEALPPGAVLSPGDLAPRISAHAGEKLLSERIRKALGVAASPETLPSLTVAVCTHDRPDRLARCLVALQALDPPPPNLETLVVDNAPSDDRTRTLVAAQPGVRYTCEPRPGLNFARNRAVREASKTLLAFLDDDVVVDARWWAGLREAWAENPDAAAFTGLVLPYALDTEAQVLFEQRGGFRRGVDKLRYCGQDLPGNPLYPCGAGLFGAGANMAFRRDVLLDLGGFDEALDTGPPLPGGGDLDIFYRVIRAGYPLVYEPQQLAFHEHRRTLDGLRRQYRSWGLGFMAFLAKSYRVDPLRRDRLRRLAVWWFKDQLWQLLESLLGRHAVSPRMILAELQGGAQGLLGEYPRSLKRIAQIRARFAKPEEGPLLAETAPSSALTQEVS